MTDEVVTCKYSVQSETSFSCLPVEIIEEILSHLSPYEEYSIAKQVCRLWYRLIERIQTTRLQDFENAARTGEFRFVCLKSNSSNSRLCPLPRFSHGCCVVDSHMYVFGGCSSSNTAFNDLYQMDLRERKWYRPITSGHPPVPKECATMVNYGAKIIIFGGWCQPSRRGVNMSAKFFNDLFVFDTITMNWSEPCSANASRLPLPCERAGHAACIVDDAMVVFGGAQRQIRFSDVWVFHLQNMIWKIPPPITGRGPAGRFGHSQITLNSTTVLIIGGCGGPNMLFNDVWLLDVSLWSWQEVKVSNTIWEAPQLWCHPAIKVRDQLVVFSVPKTFAQTNIVFDYNISRNRRDRRERLLVHSGHHRTGGGAGPSSVASVNMQTYVLDCSQVLTAGCVAWKQPVNNNRTPPAFALHSAVVCRGEIVVFGGIQTSQYADTCSIPGATNSVIVASPANTSVKLQ